MTPADNVMDGSRAELKPRGEDEPPNHESPRNTKGRLRIGHRRTVLVFFCPKLDQDEEPELCSAHVINVRWTRNSLLPGRHRGRI